MSRLHKLLASMTGRERERYETELRRFDPKTLKGRLHVAEMVRLGREIDQRTLDQIEEGDR